LHEVALAGEVLPHVIFWDSSFPLVFLAPDSIFQLVYQIHIWYAVEFTI
jgi:hypothetical protein